MLTTTAKKRTAALEEENLLTRGANQLSNATKQSSLLSDLTLKKLYVYASLLGIALIIGGLLIGIKTHNILMIECFKALTIIGFLNLVRAFSISKN